MCRYYGVMSVKLGGVEKLSELGNYEYLTPSFMAQLGFLIARPSMLKEDLENPVGIIYAMNNEVVESLKPRREGNLAELASETADIFVFWLSAQIASSSWNKAETEALQSGLLFAIELADFGGFDLNIATVDKISINERHYPNRFFQENMPYRAGRVVVKALRELYGTDFFRILGEEGVRQEMTKLLVNGNEKQKEAVTALAPFFAK